MQRYYYSNFSNGLNSVQINKGNICIGLSENNLTQDKVKLEGKLEALPELIKEGLTAEKIAKILKIPLELVQEQIEKS